MKLKLPMEPKKVNNEGGMKLFAELVHTLGTSTKTNDKKAALVHYFSHAPEKDAVWVMALFTGRRPKRTIGSAYLREWCVELTGLPLWLFEESYHTVGDLGETIALLLPEAQHTASHSLSYYLHTLIDVAIQLPEAKKAFILQSWNELSTPERFVFNKLITGGFRIGVSQQLLVQSLTNVVNLEASQIAYLLSGQWDPATVGFKDLFDHRTAAEDVSKPYPFYLCYPVEDTLPQLGPPAEWQAEWKWDGIRGQLIKRGDQLFVWSRGEELMTEKFPEYMPLLERLPNGVVLDGEIIPSQNGQPLPFALLQTRIGRKNITRKQLQEAPISFFAYDLLEYNGVDIRDTPLAARRLLLEQLVADVADPVLLLSPTIPFDDWEELAEIRMQSRDRFAEGLMLKKLDSPYLAGRKRGDWWKWKIDPLTIDAVLIYAQKGHGRRSNLYTDYTFAVRDGDQLVSFTKAYSGLTDKELGEVDAFVKRHGKEKFGPVRTVEPILVFEIAFEGIAASKRHKSGVALRFPRINRWRKDKTVAEINTIEDLNALLQQYGTSGEAANQEP